VRPDSHGAVVGIAGSLRLFLLPVPWKDHLAERSHPKAKPALALASLASGIRQHPIIGDEYSLMRGEIGRPARSHEPRNHAPRLRARPAKISPSPISAATLSAISGDEIQQVVHYSAFIEKMARPVRLERTTPSSAS
jgi:hypothetical protein